MGAAAEMSNDILQGLIRNGGINSVVSITPVANLAALRAISSSTIDNPIFVYVSGHTTAGDGGEGFFALSPGSNLPDDDGLIIVDPTTQRRYYRQWDGIHCYAAWPKSPWMMAHQSATSRSST